MIRAVTLFSLIFTLISSSFLMGSDAKDELYYERLEAALRGVVLIEGNKIGESTYSNSRELGNAFTGMGTGIIVDPKGYIITNQHVVEGLQKIIVTTYNGKRYSGVYLDRDSETDIALIKINPQETLYAIPIGESKTVRLTERVLAIGNPVGYGFSLTDGIISFLGREIKASEKLSYHNMIQTSALINPGNSGGPLLNQAGEVIAINVAIHSGAQGIAFAMPIDDVMEIAARLINKQTSQFCYHGIRLQKSAEGNLSSVIVESVDPGSPAENAGINPGDMIIAADGVSVYREIDFQRRFLEKKANETMEITVRRPNESVSLAMMLRAPGSNRFTTTAARPVQNNTQNNRGTTPTQRGNTNVGATIPAVPTPQMNSGEKTREAVIWEVFGIQVQVMPAEILKNYDETIYESYPEGAVRIVSIKTDCVFYKNGLREGDLLTGIIVGETDDLRWSIASIANLNYAAQHWDPRTLGTNEAELHIFRNKQLNLPKVPISVNTTAGATPPQRSRR